MLLLHESLYKSENLRSVDIKLKWIVLYFADFRDTTCLESIANDITASFVFEQEI